MLSSSCSAACSLSAVSFRSLSCDTVTLFLTLIFPTRPRTSPCSFWMMPFPWKVWTEGAVTYSAFKGPNLLST